MNPVFPARRRADAFDAMVEGSSTSARRDAGASTDRHDDGLAPLLELVGSLRSMPEPVARPEFVADLRSRLLLAAETELAPSPAEPAALAGDVRRDRPRRTARERGFAVAVGGFALVAASTSMSVAAQSALPGDTLYPLKRVIESLQESAERDVDDRATTMLDHAAGRLEEVDRLSREGEQDPAVIAETLEDFSDQAVEASDVLLDDFAVTGQQSSIEELRSFTATSLDALQQLQGLIPTEARGSLIAAEQVIEQIAEQALAACSACTDLPLLDTALSASVGPLLEGVLDPAADAPGTRPSAPRPDPAPGPRAGGPAPASEPVASASPTPPAASGDDEPAEQDPAITPPTGPELPTRPGDQGGSGTGGTGPGNRPLDELVTSLDDPLGDLLTGTTEVVEGLLGGGVQDEQDEQDKPGKKGK